MVFISFINRLFTFMRIHNFRDTTKAIFENFLNWNLFETNVQFPMHAYKCAVCILINIRNQKRSINFTIDNYILHNLFPIMDKYIKKYNL